MGRIIVRADADGYNEEVRIAARYLIPHSHTCKLSDLHFKLNQNLKEPLRFRADDIYGTIWRQTRKFVRNKFTNSVQSLVTFVTQAELKSVILFLLLLIPCLFVTHLNAAVPPELYLSKN